VLQATQHLVVKFLDCSLVPVLSHVSTTLKSKVYPIPHNEQGALNKFIEEQLVKGYIVPSKSLMASPVFFVKKKNGELRLIQDYRKLNDITIKNRYPLPLAADIINRL
jgi:hypothetical protein